MNIRWAPLKSIGINWASIEIHVKPLKIHRSPFKIYWNRLKFIEISWASIEIHWAPLNSIEGRCKSIEIHWHPLKSIEKPLVLLLVGCIAGFSIFFLFLFTTYATTHFGNNTKITKNHENMFWLHYSAVCFLRWFRIWQWEKPPVLTMFVVSFLFG